MLEAVEGTFDDVAAAVDNYDDVIEYPRPLPDTVFEVLKARRRTGTALKRGTLLARDQIIRSAVARHAGNQMVPTADRRPPS
jgi:hypothetical protein